MVTLASEMYFCMLAAAAVSASATSLQQGDLRYV